MSILCVLGVWLPAFGCAEEDDANSTQVVPEPEPEPEKGKFVVVAPATLITSESGTALRGSLALDKSPSAPVVVTLTSSDTTEGVVDPKTLTFDSQNFDTAQTFTITGQADGIADGDITYTVTATSSSDDESFAAQTAFTWSIVNRDIDADDVPPTVDGTPIRFMAANITSDGDGYDPDAGRNIFKAVKPDIAMIQEFRLSKQKPADFFAEIFGPEFHYFVGSFDSSISEKSSKPNAIASRFPIIDTGEWRPQNRKDGRDQDAYKDRFWTYAVVDIPGDRDLLVVSVHLHTENNRYEYEPLAEKIIAKQKEGDYYVAIGGDFNTKGLNYEVLTTQCETFRSIFALDTSKVPVDQNGNANTNAKRGSQLDWVLFDKDFDAFAVPTEIGAHTGKNAYPYGHVFDTRVYANSYHNGVCELTLVPPATERDSAAKEMQHMAVIRDVVVPDKN